MRFVIILIFFLLGSTSLFLAGCPGKSSPTAPNPTRTSTAIPTSTSTETFAPTGTSTTSPTGTSTSSPSVIGTSSSTPTPSPTNTPTGSWTPTFSRTFTSSFTPTFTPSQTATATSTETPLCGSPLQFGGNYVGSSHAAPSLLLSTRYTLPEDGTVTSLLAHLQYANCHVRAALYADNGSGTAPTTLLRQSDAVFLSSGSPQWHSFEVQDIFLTAGHYWFAWIQENNGTRIHYQPNAGPTGTNAISYFQGYSPEGFPSSFTVDNSTQDHYSLFALFCPSTQSTLTRTPTPSHSPTFTPIPTATATSTETPFCGSPLQFGGNYVGSSYSALNGLVATRYLLPEDGTVAALHAFLEYALCHVQVGLYADNGSGTAPTTLIRQSQPYFLSAGGPQWHSLEIPDVLLPAGVYWLAWAQENNGTAIHRQPNAGPPGTYAISYSQGYSPPDLPGTFTLDNAISDQLSLYGSYCPASDPVFTRTPTPSHSPTFTPTHTATATSTETPFCGSPLQFGGNTIGSSYGAFTNLVATRYTLPEDGTVTGLKAYLEYALCNVRVFLYADNGSGTAPTTLIRQSQPYFLSAGAPQWHSLEIPDVFLPAGDYWLAWAQENNNTAIHYQPNAGGPGTHAISYFQGYSPEDLFGTFTMNNATQDQLSLYAEFCP